MTETREKMKEQKEHTQTHMHAYMHTFNTLKSFPLRFVIKLTSIVNIETEVVIFNGCVAHC